jgi:Fic family protein
MEEKDFETSKTGRAIWKQNGPYFRFEPNPLPFSGFIPSQAIGNALLNTALALGRLDGITQKLTAQEVHLLRLPFILKEATLSSEIEGTISTLTDIYKEEKQNETNTQKILDNEEIRNYVKALEYGLGNLDDGITEKVIKEMHKILLQGVRGSGKNPGEYKTEQNAIGKKLDTLETAKFVPASPKETSFLLKNLVDFLNNDFSSNAIYKIAIAHYQFEAIHAFRDGNGRIGRLLIILGLSKEKILTQPLLYLSEYFNRNRSTYTNLLYNVSSKNEIEEWMLFFLQALETQANSSLQLIQSLENYRQQLQESMKEASESPKMHLLVDVIFRNPFITITDVSEKLNLTITWSSNLVHKLEQKGILREITGKKSRKIFVAQKILDLLEG